MLNMLYALGSIFVRDVTGLRLVNIFGIWFFDRPNIYAWEVICRNKIIAIMNVSRIGPRTCSFKFRGILGLSIVVYVLCPVVPWASFGEPALVVDSCPFGSDDLTNYYGRSNPVLCCLFSVLFFGEPVLSPNSDPKILICVASIFGLFVLLVVQVSLPHKNAVLGMTLCSLNFVFVVEFQKCPLIIQFILLYLRSFTLIYFSSPNIAFPNYLKLETCSTIVPSLCWPFVCYYHRIPLL